MIDKREFRRAILSGDMSCLNPNLTQVKILRQCNNHEAQPEAPKENEKKNDKTNTEMKPPMHEDRQIETEELLWNCQ